MKKVKRLCCVVNKEAENGTHIFCTLILISFWSHFDSIAPTSAPANISGQAVDSTGISISWNPPPFENQNGIIRHYAVNITELETGITFSRVSLTTSISLHNLHPFYRYSVTVTAVTVGPSPASIAFTVQTREDGRFLFSLDFRP